MESLHKLREPAAVVLLVALALRLLLAVVGLGAAWRDHATGSSLVAASGTAASTALDGLSLVLLAVLVAACVLWRPSPHARQLRAAALVGTALSIVLFLVATAVELSAAGVIAGLWADVVRVVLAVVVPLLSLVVLVRLRQGQRAEDPDVASSAGVTPSVTAEQAKPELTAAPDPGSAPVWQPDQASGAAWLTAGEAAAGAAASRWGTPGDAGGWQPQGGSASGRPQSEERPDTSPAQPPPDEWRRS